MPMQSGTKPTRQSQAWRK